MQLYTDEVYSNLNLFPISLPLELTKIILSYTQLLQPDSLLTDIASFYAKKAQFTEIYYNRWVINYGRLEPEDSDWLSNDLISYANDFQPTSNGIVPNMIEKWRKLFLLRDKDAQYITDAINPLILNKAVTPSKQINTFLGIFTPDERDQFNIL